MIRPRNFQSTLQFVQKNRAEWKMRQKNRKMYLPIRLVLPTFHFHNELEAKGYYKLSNNLERL